MEHHLAEKRSLAFHRRVAEKLRQEPARLERARQRVRQWEVTGAVHPHYQARWKDLLDQPLDRICRALVDDGEQATALRQVTPFAGFLEPRERWAIWRQVRQSAETAR